MTTRPPVPEQHVPEQPPSEHLELVVLLDAEGRPCGVAPKETVHTRDTPLHLAFSCWLLDGAGGVLITQRSRSKRTWPGVWTNAFCGHPAPGEAVVDAVRRRARQELGTRIEALRVVLPAFRYRAVMGDGTVENELCPVYLAQPCEPHFEPDPGEVMDRRWVSVPALAQEVARQPDRYSPWLQLQLPLLLAEGGLAAARGAGDAVRMDQDR